jgi:hypothetical protein
MSPSERFRFLHEFGQVEMDSASFADKYRIFSAVCEAKKDRLGGWVLDYYRFQQRRILKPTKEETLRSLEDLVASAKQNGFETEALVAQHYLVFEQYGAKEIQHEVLYAAILKEFDQMEELGFERFKDYDLARLLKHDGMILYDLEDFEKALAFLLVAERYIQAEGNGAQTAYLVLNHIQSIYQQQKDYAKGIEYAKKILELVEAATAENPTQEHWFKEWAGMAKVDIAAMLVGQQKFAEGETYADQGYVLVKALDNDGLQSEYEALQVLVPTKLELGKIGEATQLLQRMKLIYETIGKNDYLYFKNIKYFENFARYYEMKGDFATAMQYTNLAKPLKDSLERRNDARKLEKITQRIEAEKYMARLQLVESEKQFQKLLRNAAIVILLLVSGLAYGNYHRLQFKRRQALKELEAAKGELATFTQHLKEKSELAENLRSEMDRLSKSGERSEYLEKLTNSTILTDEDWTQFRNIFEKVHPNFIAEQKTAYPDLTQAELRYLVLEKLQLTTHEMANMLGVSDGTVRQTRMRMKRKIGEG